MYEEGPPCILLEGPAPAAPGGSPSADVDRAVAAGVGRAPNGEELGEQLFFDPVSIIILVLTNFAICKNGKGLEEELSCKVVY